MKDHEEQKRSLKTQVIQEQQKLVDCEREWKDIVGKQEREIKDLKMEVRGKTRFVRLNWRYLTKCRKLT